MSTFKKTVAAALTALTLGTAAFSTAAEAKPILKPFPMKPFKPFPGKPHHHGHWGVGAGIIGGLALAGAIAASSAYAAEEDAPVRRCYLVDRVNSWGDVVGTRRVCRLEY